MEYVRGMTARILRASIALLTLLAEIRYTLSRLTAAAVLPAFLTKLQAARDVWTAVQNKEIAFQEQLSDAQAQVDIADDGLDDFAVRFSQAVLALTGQKRDAELYTHYFKKPLHELIRPVLSGQLKAMEQWITSLKGDKTPPSLAAMLPELVTLVAAGKKASETRDEIRTQIKQFREVGERRQLLDQVNALRKELHGALSKHALETPGLPADYANQFFKPSDSGEDEPEETIESLGVEIKHLEAALKEKQDRLATLQKEADDAAEKQKKKAEKDAKIAALNKEIEDKQKQMKALEDETDE